MTNRERHKSAHLEKQASAILAEAGYSELNCSSTPTPRQIKRLLRNVNRNRYGSNLQLLLYREPNLKLDEPIHPHTPISE